MEVLAQRAALAAPRSMQCGAVSPQSARLQPSQRSLGFKATLARSAPSLRLRAKSTGFRHRSPQVIVARAATDLKEEMQEFAAAEKRWHSQVSDGKVKSMTPKEAGYAYQLADYVLLDVRPTFERNKSRVKDSLWVPAFEPDKSMSPGSMANKLSIFLFGGWWSGNIVTKRNERFMADVVAKIPKGSNVIVACQRGLRSLAACEQMYKAGYRNLYWIKGGLDAAEEEDFKREGPEPLKFAGLGGFSEFVGLTGPQRQKAQVEGLGYRAIFFGRAIAVLIALDLLFVSLQQVSAILRGEAQ